MSMTRLETFCNLGYKRDPFKVGSSLYETGDMARIRRILTMAVESRAMVSIVGERGIGKSKSVEAALEKIGVRRISVEKAQKERLSIADIQKAMLLDLKEAPKKDGELMARQLRRVVGEASAKQARPLVVVIEEAQRLHGNTLRSLKTLREIEWMGERELFSVVLVAQSDPMNRAGVSEVRLRTDLIQMHGLSPDEATGYLRATIGKHFSDEALEAVGELPQATNYLELQELSVLLLNHTLADGRNQVNAADVQDVFGAKQAAPLPKTVRKQKPVETPVTGSAALRSVIGRRSETTGAETDGRAAC